MKVGNLRFFEALDGLIGSEHESNHGRFKHYIAGCEDMGELLFQFMVYFDFWAINMAYEHMNKYFCWGRDSNIAEVLNLYKQLFFDDCKLLDRLVKYNIVRKYLERMNKKKTIYGSNSLKLINYYIKHSIAFEEVSFCNRYWIMKNAKAFEVLAELVVE